MAARATALLRRWYFAFALAAFVFSPEIRRVVDWQTSFHKLSLFSVVPLATMLPGAFLLFFAWKRLGSLYRLVSKIWLGAFGVALVLGAVAGSPASAGYDMLLFATPALFAVFLASSDEDPAASFARIAGTMLCFGVVSSLYAIYQYVSPPPWDVYWVVNSGLVSTGIPEPFGLRVFGTLNAYATFAHYIALTMIVNLPRMRPRNWPTVAAYVPCAIALLLTSDRTAWLAFAAGLLVYLIAAPSRRRAFGALLLAATLCAGVSGALLLSLKGSDDVATLVGSRFASLGAIGDDNSFADRQVQTAHALHEGVEEPLGQGLGDVGTAAVAGSTGSTNTLDNGYLARFVELGVAGCAAYLLALGIALAGVAGAYRASLREGDAAVSSVLAAALAVQVMMLGMDLSTDTHNGLLGVFFWFSLYAASRYRAQTSEVAMMSTRAIRWRTGLTLGSMLAFWVASSGATLAAPNAESRIGDMIVNVIGIRGTDRVPLADGDEVGFSENIGLELAHPVDPRILAHAITIAPPAPHTVQVFGSRLTIAFRKIPSTSYEIAIPAGVSATDGYVTTERSVLRVHTSAVPVVAPLRQTPGEPYRYGTLAHPFSNSLAGPDADRIMDAFARAGVRFVRIEYPAAQILGEDTPKPQPDFSTLDRIADALEARGITELPALTQYTVPKFQAEGQGYPSLQADPADFARYAGLVAEHLKRYPKIARIEIFNEPNLHNWWTYPTLGGAYDDRSGRAAAVYMKAAYAAIKKANPKLEVGGPELAVGGHDTDPRTFLENMYQAGCRTGVCWDFLTVHNYRWDDPTYRVSSKLANRWDIYKDLQQIAVSHADPKPHVMLTEWGFSTVMTPDGFDPAVQAYFMALGFNLMLEDPTVDGVAYVNVYTGGPDDNFYAATEVMRNDFTPLPGFAVLQRFSKGIDR